MSKRKIFDVVFILIAFGIYLIILNVDKQIDNCNIVSRNIWIPLVLAYYAGRFVSLYTGGKKSV
ncbi:MAG TPA: hypothetical protein PLV51_05185 [Lentimicrobium sp.]|jgi:hypothetical protein|nr:hypothetical protein [Lentimicrobium sp.]